MDNPTAPAAPPAAPRLLDRKGQAYEPAVSPVLKPVLALLFLGFALLAATGAYLTIIRLLGLDKQNAFFIWVFLVHLAVGALLLLPFFLFGIAHWSTARHRKNKRAVRLGKLLFFVGAAVCLSGVLLMQLHDDWQLPKDTLGRWVVFYAHLGTPVLAVGVYVLHRRAGPDINWKWGYGWAAAVAVFVVAMSYLHKKDLREFQASIRPKEGDGYFHPSATRTAGGTFVSADTYMMDEYCMKCHQDIYNDHLHSAHKRSSFNNPPYLFSVRETRKKAGIRAARWCAGCHDPVPFLSGKFDDPNYDDVNDQTAKAGITCTVCHSMTQINSTKGNGDYVIEEPLHYPFASSKNSFLQWVNNRLVKAKPDFHKKTFLKPFHKTDEFCSTCHKVSLPVELNKYKEFLRGQDHFNSSELSGARHGARSFYYPPQAKDNCAGCHMPLLPSNDFGTKDFDKTGVRKRHDHSFPAANTGLPWLLSLDPTRGDPEKLRQASLKQAAFLRDKQLRIDLFGLKEGGGIDGKLTKLRPDLPALKPGETYLVEVVVRTLGLGHPFTQGTADSNEVWVNFEAVSGGKVFAQSGGMVGKKGCKGEKKPDDSPAYFTLDDRPVEKWSHFINLLMLDRAGNRINRRNPQDIFTPMYNHQIPPGASQVVHYKLTVPKDVDPAKPVTLKVRLRFRKFDFEYMSLVHGGDDKVPQLPVVDVCEDAVTLAVAGGPKPPPQQSPIKPAWQRWNDYGIACLIEGGVGSKKGELRQAEEAFTKVRDSGDKVAAYQGRINLARVAIDLGHFDEARAHLDKVPAPKDDPTVPWWTVAWLTAKVNVENGNFDDAARDLEKVLDPRYQPHERKFDFTKDYLVINDLADVYFKLANRYADDPAERDKYLAKAIARYEQTLKLDSEDLDAHFGLEKCYEKLGKGLPASARAPDVAPEKALDELKRLADVFTDAGRPKQERLDAALGTGKAATALGRQTFKEETKRPAFDYLRERCVKVFREDGDPAVRAAAAYVLARAHRELYAIFKPDDLAVARARQIYKDKPGNKAADQASQAIILYPTDRLGAKMEPR